MLAIEDLHVSVNGLEILKGVNLSVPSGEVHALFGPNGSGKTTLMMTIMGYPPYKVTKGKILFKEKDITSLSIDERANLGIGVSMQRPPTIKGVQLKELIDKIKERFPEREHYIEAAAREFNVEKFFHRDINEGFSGGELKKTELFQAMITQPEFLLMDEPDSGVDPQRLVTIGRMANEILRIKEPHELKIQRHTGLIITHSGFILDYVHADKAHLLIDGVIRCNGNPRIMIEQIKSEGYEYCITCHRRSVK